MLSRLSRRACLVFAVGNLATAALAVVGVFVALPARWAPVDAAAVTLVVLEVAAAAALLVPAVATRPWAALLVRVNAGAGLAVGLGLVTVLALTASWLSGVYGSVGRGGAIVLVLVAALAVPYLVALPTMQLVWLVDANAAARTRR